MIPDRDMGPHCGVPMMIKKMFERPEFWNAIEAQEATNMLLVPAMINGLLKARN